MASNLSLRSVAGLLALTCLAILVHGYHPYVEDAEIYAPGIKHILRPELYPQNQQFFSSHAHLTLFPNLIAATVRFSHLPLEWMLLLWHFCTVLALLVAGWRLAGRLFRDPLAAWGSAGLIAGLLTIPVAGTALYIMDQYLNPRSISTPAILFAFISFSERKYLRSAICIVLTGLVHPLMVLFGGVFLACYFLMDRKVTLAGNAALLAFPLSLVPHVEGAYREVLDSHSYFLVTRWEWYEWLGALAPLVLLWWFSRIANRRNLRTLAVVCQALIVFQLIFLVLGLAVCMPALAGLARLQPMRSLHWLYVVLFVICGGMLAQSVLKDRPWRWIALFVPLGAGMWFAQTQLFDATEHLELPGRATRNPWVQAFAWIRDRTPIDAYFALNPDHMELPGEDQHGFRAIAERSMLADRIKDSGAVSMFPALADTWRDQVRAQDTWTHFGVEDFQHLKRTYGVDWIVWESAPPRGLQCPYSNPAVHVCRID
jgi:hypothetical protein